MAKFATIDEYLDSIPSPEHRAKLQELLEWIAGRWPELELVLKWNQPMFTHHGVFIIGFSVFAKNIAASPEKVVLDRMRGEIEAAGYTTTQQLFRIGWDDPVDHELLERMIEIQLAEKADQTGFWRS